MEEWQKKYHILKEQETPCFSLKQMESFIEAITNQKSSLTPYESMRRRAMIFMERGYSPVWQFDTYVSKTNKDLDGAIVSIPILLDASYIFTLIPDAFNPLIIQSYHNAINWEQNKETGFFNYIIGHGENLCPDDVDTSSITVMALLMTRYFNKTEAKQLAGKMLATCMKDKNGVYISHFPAKENKNMTLLDAASMFKFPTDMGVVLNFLLLLAELQMDLDPQLKASLNALDEALDELMDVHDDGQLTTNNKFYTNPFVLIGFFSRFLERACVQNRERFEQKLKRVVEKRLQTIGEKFETSMNLGCLIVAAMSLKVYKIPELKQLILEYARKIVRDQNMEDGGFSTWYFYTWKDVGYWGSRYIATAFALNALEMVGREFGQEELDKMFK